MNPPRLPWPRRPLPRFLAGFALLYALLLAPWPGLGETYHHLFIKSWHQVFFSRSGLRAVWFESSATPERPYNAKICLANRQTFLANGGVGPVHSININSRGYGWRPSALIAALFLATPAAWRRRAGGLAIASIGFHALLYFSFWFLIWKNSAHVGLTAPPEWQMTAGAEVQKLLVMTLGVIFPLSVWLLFAMRQPGFLNSGFRSRSSVTAPRPG